MTLNYGIGLKMFLIIVCVETFMTIFSDNLTKQGTFSFKTAPLMSSKEIIGNHTISSLRF